MISVFFITRSSLDVGDLQRYELGVDRAETKGPAEDTNVARGSSLGAAILALVYLMFRFFSEALPEDIVIPETYP